MILHLIRHSKPLIDLGICYGRLDVAAENVAATAERLLAELPSGLPVWSSPLLRCRALAEALHPRPVLDARLVEMNFGAWEGRPWEAIPRREIDAWAADVADFVPPGGESARAVQQRALAFVEELAVPEAVLVTHGGVIRVLQAAWLDLPPAAWSGLSYGFASRTTVHLNR